MDTPHTLRAGSYTFQAIDAIVELSMPHTRFPFKDEAGKRLVRVAHHLFFRTTLEAGCTPALQDQDFDIV